MRDRRELLGHITAHTLGVGVGGDELGVLGLDLLKLDQELVEGGVRDLGSIERVVAVGMIIEQVAQLSRTGRGAIRPHIATRRGAFRHGVVRRHIAKQALLLRHVGLLGTCVQPLQGTITRTRRARPDADSGMTARRLAVILASPA